MDNHQYIITQGSTPTLELRLPFEFPDTGGVAFATFAQGDKNVLEYGLNGTATALIAGTGTLTVAEDDASVLYLAMTQADTLKLTPGDVELQLRVKTTDGADTFLPVIGAVVKAHKTGVIT
jgi:hypothetical protein